MRVDHHAYRKATKVSGFGFILQAIIAIALFVFSLGLFGRGTGDVVIYIASIFAVGGLLVWLSLIVIFYQHTQERLESLEGDEIAADLAGSGSVFDSSREHDKPASRRLKLMHKWLMPIVSLIVAAYLSLAAWRILKFIDALEDPVGVGDFVLTEAKGWAAALCLGFATISFIFSRFVAGMARQEAWQNLRGGAGFMVGNSLVLMAVAVGIIFRIFKNDQVIGFIAYAIPVCMFIMAVEIIFNFILNLYRPRIADEVPRPAFDSRVLSLLSAPDSIVKSINEAVNYQFGFDITSSWGYQLLLRSTAWLVLFGVLSLAALNTMVIVEPHQQAIKLAGGRIVGEVHQSGIMWKWPWPIQSAHIIEVDRIRELRLTAFQLFPTDIDDWAKDPRMNKDLEPFIVGPSIEKDDESSAAQTVSLDNESAENVEDAADTLGDLFSLVDAEITLQYRIKSDGVLDYLKFSSELQGPRITLTHFDKTLKSIALREITQHLSGLSLQEVIVRAETSLARDLRSRVQQAFDQLQTGVFVVAISLPMLRPSGGAGTYFENFAIAKHQRRQEIENEQGAVTRALDAIIGHTDRIDEILDEFNKWDQMQRDHDVSANDLRTQRLLVEQLIEEAGGDLAQRIARAEAQSWVILMNARAEVFRHKGNIESYRASPSLFMEREIMRVFIKTLGEKRKYFLVGVDPDRINLEVEVQEVPARWNISPQTPDEGDQ